MHERAYLLWKKSTILFFILLTAVLLLDRNDLFLAINSGASHLGDLFWTIISNCGDGFMAILAVLFFARRRPDMVRATLIGTVIALPFTQITKAVTTVVRPGFFHPDTANLIGTLPGSWSFPSGHTATAALIFGVIFLMADRRPVRWCAFTLMILVGISRIAVGVHWPLDVVCGWIVGLSSAAAGVMLTNDNRKCTLKTVVVPFILTLAAINFTTGYSLNPEMNLIQKIYGTIAITAGGIAIKSILKEARSWKM